MLGIGAVNLWPVILGEGHVGEDLRRARPHQHTPDVGMDCFMQTQVLV